MYLKTGDDTIDSNRDRLHVVGDIHKIIWEVGVIDHVDGSDGRRFTTSCDIVVDGTFSRLLADLKATVQSERQGNIAVRPITTLDTHTRHTKPDINDSQCVTQDC